MMKNFVVNVSRSCWRHDILNLSANISFFAIVSLLPLVMIFIAVLGHIIGSETVLTHITDMANAITEVIPGAKEIFLSNLGNLLERKKSLGIWGVGFLVITSTFLFSSLERSFDRIFGSEKRRHFLLSRLIAILVIFLILLFLFLPSAIRLVESVFIKYGYSVPLSSYFSGTAFFVIFAILSFVVTVTIVTNRRVYVRYAFIGGVIYTTGIGIAKYLFRWYVSIMFARYDLIYGSLSALVLMVIWIYYLALILLFSAEVVAYFQRGKVYGR